MSNLPLLEQLSDFIWQFPGYDPRNVKVARRNHSPDWSQLLISNRCKIETIYALKQGRPLTKEGLAYRIAKQIQKFIEVTSQQQSPLVDSADLPRIGPWEIQHGLRSSMGDWSRCHDIKEHVARPDLPRFEGLVATGTVVGESLK